MREPQHSADGFGEGTRVAYIGDRPQLRNAVGRVHTRNDRVSVIVDWDKPVGPRGLQRWVVRKSDLAVLPTEAPQSLRYTYVHACPPGCRSVGLEVTATYFTTAIVPTAFMARPYRCVWTGVELLVKGVEHQWPREGQADPICVPVDWYPEGVEYDPLEALQDTSVEAALSAKEFEKALSRVQRDAADRDLTLRAAFRRTMRKTGAVLVPPPHVHTDGPAVTARQGGFTFKTNGPLHTSAPATVVGRAQRGVAAGDLVDIDLHAAPEPTVTPHENAEQLGLFEHGDLLPRRVSLYDLDGRKRSISLMGLEAHERAAFTKLAELQRARYLASKKATHFATKDPQPTAAIGDAANVSEADAKALRDAAETLGGPIRTQPVGYAPPIYVGPEVQEAAERQEAAAAEVPKATRVLELLHRLVPSRYVGLANPAASERERERQVKLVMALEKWNARTEADLAHDVGISPYDVRVAIAPMAAAMLLLPVGEIGGDFLWAPTGELNEILHEIDDENGSR